eukprot:4045345-Karenia_brevis.AAC.1
MGGEKIREEQQWDGDLVRGLKGTLQRPNPEMPGIDVPITIHAQPEDPDAEEKSLSFSELKHPEAHT